MKRRTYIKALLAAGAGSTLAPAVVENSPIQLHLDLSVDASREKELVNYFNTVFKPAAAKFPGYIDVRMIKLRSALQGSAPRGLKYRWMLQYESEELRQKWIASEVHQKVWPPMERMLSSMDYCVLLFDAT
jgi:antibiotic biosynthesis monooxygenase (ABM) superfamily enzyme